MNIKDFLWRVVYAVILVVILTIATPLLFQIVGAKMPDGPAIALLRFAFACLILLYVFFGSTPPTPF